MMRKLFATSLYEADVAGKVMLGELAHSIRSLSQDDEAGRRWSKEHRYAGYTSYASLNDLPKRYPTLLPLLPKLRVTSAVPRLTPPCVRPSEAAIESSRTGIFDTRLM